MTKILCTYNGDGQTTLFHGPTNEQILTDLPPDNGGKGRRFSPTDLFASALASCALTIMGKMAASKGESLEGASIEIEKIMAENPRRVAKFILNISFPKSISEQDKKKYIASIHACPVHNSLSKEVALEINAN